MPNTREKLIDIVEYYADFLDLERKEDIVDRIMELLATDNNVGDKWISVKDRLPENGQYAVLFDEKERYMGMGEFRGTFWYDSNHQKCGLDEVTHWMPLPEPPKGE